MRLSQLKAWQFLALGASGVLGALAFPLAFPVADGRELLASGILEPLAFICLVPALVATRALNPTASFLAGFLAGWVFFTGAFWWVYIAMTSFAPIAPPLAVLFLLLLAGWCAFHWALAFGLAAFLEARLGWKRLWTFAPIWLSTELLRNYFCSGYPWANLGYSQARNLYFSQVASLVGIYGIALLVAAANLVAEQLFYALRRERPFPARLAGGAAMVLVAAHLYGFLRVRAWELKLVASPKLKVAVIQGNIDQKLKNQQGRRVGTILQAYNPPTVAADAAGADLVVWPEASFPRAFPTGKRSMANVGLAQPSYRSHLLLGVDLYDPLDLRGGSENAAFLVRPDLQVSYKYTKHHLVPFGEYIPLKLDKLLPIDNVVPGTFVAGQVLEPVSVPFASAAPGMPSEAKIGILICFDAIFPEISRAYVRDGVDVLVNMTNDAWYGFSSAPYQFLRMVAMRSVETGRPTARAANTGVSAFIDPLGRVFDATRLGMVATDGRSVRSEELIASEWRMRELPIVSAKTLYVVLGDVPAYLAAAFSVVGFALGLLKRRT